MSVVLVAVHIFRNNPSAIDNYFIYSLLDKDFCAVKKKKKKNRPFTDLRTSKNSVSMVRE